MQRSDGWSVTLGVDVGGTFTDIVRWDGRRLSVGKTSSTDDQSEAVLLGAGRLVRDQKDALLVHGTTVATNALLERAGSRVALVTDPGFEDLIEIGRQDRPSLYDHDVLRPEPLVPRARRMSTVPGSDLDADIVAVVLIDSYREPRGERDLVGHITDVVGMPAIASADVSREFREYERLSTTVLTAYLQPIVSRYLQRLEREVAATVADRLLVMASNGGLIPAQQAATNAAAILLSGPAGGVMAAAAYGEALGHGTVISFDMGGTSTDVCRVTGGAPEVTYERQIEGYVCRLPSVAIHTVGAGGGSVGWVDSGGALRVGPRSAGAIPGPASYQRGGTEPAVTDADLVVGRLSPDLPLADGLYLDRSAAESALASVGARVGLGPAETAAGMIQVVETHMDRAIRRVSVEEGFDPAGAALVAFGGAGGMHASPLARRLGMGTVLVPPHAGVLSALGLLLSPPRLDTARTVFVDPDEIERLRRTAAEMETQITDDFRAAVGTDPDRILHVVDLRYSGQAHETSIPFDRGEDAAGLTSRFHAAHRVRNGFDRPDDQVEV
ncbi:MAG: hydantoinase/oxoprolinase family protein, partial [Acidimicrobiia bacterium]|nr:hydantoinase/oxoprolinase family protein [Acidimicrobiia bacterium]